MTTSDQQIVSLTTGEVSKLLDRFAEAQRLSDVDALRRLLTDDFALVGPLGFVVPKERWLEQFQSGALRIESLEWDEVDIRTYADAGLAIAIGKLTQAGTYAGNRSDGQLRVTLIAIGHGVTWQLAGNHYSPIATPAAPPHTTGRRSRQAAEDQLKGDTMTPRIDTLSPTDQSNHVAGMTSVRGTKITNPGGRYHRASLVEPSPSGYVHVAAQIDPPTRPGPARPTRARNEALARLSRERSRLAQQHPDWSVELFRAVGFPPLDSLPIPERYRSAAAFYDVVVLIKTITTAELPSLSQDAAYQAMLDALDRHARGVTITQARNARRIADVPSDQKLHLFNHFLAEDAGALDVWDYVAGWYQQEMRLKNSEVLAPIDPHSTPFAFINHASWNMTLPRFIARQLTRPSFRTFVLAILRDNDIGSLPYLYRHLDGAS